MNVFCIYLPILESFPGGSTGKESTESMKMIEILQNQCRRCERCRFNSWVGKIPWRRKWQPIPVFLAGKFHEQRSLASYSSWGHKELDGTEWLNWTELHWSKENGQFMLKRPEHPIVVFRGGFSKAVWGGAAGCLISLCSILALVDIKVKFLASSVFWF